MSQAAERDPFGSTSDARAYVPRPACEAALAELLVGLRAGGRRLALTGPNGIGKTQLLRVLEERLADEAEVLILPYAGVEFEDLCRWVLGLWGDTGPSDDLRSRLLEEVRAHAARGRPPILVLDDASGMPVSTARELGRLIDEAAGALRVLVVPVDDPRAGRLLAAFGRDLETVRFSTPMTRDETAFYVRERLRWAAPAEEIAARFDEGTVRWLHRASGGLPRELHRLALQIQRGIGREAAQADSGVPWLDVEPDVLEADREEEVVGREILAPPQRVSVPPERSAAESELETDGAPTRAPTPVRYVAPPQPGEQGSAARPPVQAEGAGEPRRVPELPAEESSGFPRRALGVAAVVALVAGFVGAWWLAGGLGSTSTPAASEALSRETASSARPSVQVRGADAPAAQSTQPNESGLSEASLPLEAPGLSEASLSLEAPGQAASLDRAAPAAGVDESAAPRSGVPEVAPSAAAAPGTPEPTATVVPLPVEPAQDPLTLGKEAPSAEPATAALPEATDVAIPSEVARIDLQPDSSPKVSPAGGAKPTGRVALEEASVEPGAEALAAEPSTAVHEAATYEVSVNAVPWAIVLIDGIARGTTPLAGIALTEGVHRFRLLHADGRIREADRRVSADERAFAFGLEIPSRAQSTADPVPATSPPLGP